MKIDARYQGHRHFIPYLLNRVTSRLNAELNAELYRRRMTLKQWRVLAFLEERDGVPVNDLAESTATDQATLSRLLTQLQKRGLIERRPRAEDQRYVEVHLTRSGRSQFREVLPIAMDIKDRAVQGLDAGEEARLTALLERLLQNLGPGESSPTSGAASHR